MLQDDDWDEPTTTLMDSLAGSLRESNAASITSSALGPDQRPVSMYSVAMVGELIVGVALDCGAETLGVRWGLHEDR